VFAQPDSSDIVIRFGGDCIFSENYERMVQTDTLRAFRGFDLFKTADVAMVNLECPVTIRGTKREKPFTFRMKRGFLNPLLDAGIDLVTIANNHIYDYDSTGLFDTIDNLDSAGIRHVGAGRTSTDAHRPVVYEIHGKRLAFLAYYGGGEAPAAGIGTPGVADRSLTTIREDVVHAKEMEKADFVFVNLHWGVEKEQTPEPDQIAFAHRLIEDGVDVIIGHHPHVLQPVEEYKNGVIAYSLGNLIFGGNSRHTYETALLEVRIQGNDMTHFIRPVSVEEWNAKEMAGAEARRVVQMIEALPLTTND
jgi:poly-gamma-glutamate capsule biosynthesis protein CapA/YwtB (metallophosphatase superfamily)